MQSYGGGAEYPEDEEGYGEDGEAEGYYDDEEEGAGDEGGGGQGGYAEEEQFDLGALAEEELAAQESEQDEEEEEEEEEEEDDDEMEGVTMDQQSANLLMQLQSHANMLPKGQQYAFANMAPRGQQPVPRGGRGRGGAPPNERGGGRTLSSGLRVGTPHETPPESPPDTPSLGGGRGGRGGGGGGRGGRGGQGVTPRGRGGRGRGRGGSNAYQGPPIAGDEPLSDWTMSQLREFANELPDNKRPFHGYLEKFLSGSWDFVTFLSQGYMKLTKEQFSKLESFFTPAQRAVLTPDMRSQKYKRRQSMKEEEEDQPGTPVGMQKRGPNAQSPTFIESQPAAKRMKTEPVPNYGSPRPPIRPQGVMPTSTPVRPSPLGMQSPINGPQFRPGMGGPVTGPRPPGQYAVRPPTQPGTPGVAYAFQPGPRPPAAGRPGQGRAAEGGIDDAFDASLNSGVDLQAEEKGLLRFGDDSGKMGDQHLRYSTPPQSEVEAKQLVKARMVEIARGSGSETALNVNDGAATAMAGCLDDLLRSLIEKMVVASKHRNGIYRQMLEEDSTREVQRTGSGVEFRYQKTTDVKAVIEDLRSKERTRELEERRKVAELQKDVEMQNSLDMAELAKKAKKKTLSVKRIEENLPAEIKARNQRNAIEKSIGSKKTYGWLEGGGKSDGLVPTAKAGGPPKPGPGITARELKQQQRLEQHAKKMARVVNVEDALLVLEKDRRFRLSKANMRWVAWRDAKLVAQPGPK